MALIPEAVLMERVSALLGKSFEEVPCYGLIERVFGIPLTNPAPVNPDFVQVGDVVLFGESEDRFGLDRGLGIYLGNGKVVSSLRGWGVVIIPWKVVRHLFVQGVRHG